MRLSKNFTRDEFRCKCGKCSPDNVRIDSGLVQIIQRIRNVVDVPLVITSGVRCKEHNETIPGAAKRSWHVPRGEPGSQICFAADFSYYERDLRTSMGMLKLYVLADEFNAKGIGLYPGRIHIDTRPEGRARWTHKTWTWEVTQ